MTEDEIRRISELLAAAIGGDPQAQADFVRELGDALAAPFAEGLMAGTEAIGGAIAFDLANERAVAWAQTRGADLITQVDETTKDLIRGMVSRELEAGVTVQDLTDDLMQAFGDFSEYRAERIARTETANAMNQGTIEGYRDADVGFVEVLDGPGCLPDGHDDGAPEADPDVYGLQDEAQANGQIWSLDDAAAYPVGHPNCVRAFAAVVPAPPAEEA
jgi:hypothetical protein